MTPGQRYDKFKDAPLDYVIMRIKRGEVKAGRFAHIVSEPKKSTIGKESYELHGTTREANKDFRKSGQRFETMARRKTPE